MEGRKKGGRKRQRREKRETISSDLKASAQVGKVSQPSLPPPLPPPPPSPPPSLLQVFCLGEVPQWDSVLLPTRSWRGRAHHPAPGGKEGGREGG